MYIVTITNNGVDTEIHGTVEKLHSGSVSKGINAIDAFTFSLLPSNIGFSRINEYTTLVKVYNTNRARYDFIGRALYAETKMADGGLITKDVTCESIFGYLCDSQQPYVDTKNWTVTGLLQTLIDNHNSQVEEYKHFKLGEVTVKDNNDNLYLGIQRENTWQAITTKLIDKLGGEIRYRVVDGEIYLDYLEQIGKMRSTKIELSVNMKSITREKDPTAYVTRLIPLGCKLSKEVEKVNSNGTITTETVETEERLDISGVNDGKNYIDDETAIAVYGIHVGYVEYDDVTSAANLLTKGRAWLADNNKVQIKYSITALDLSLLGLVYDDFEVGNFHPIVNALLGIDDIARINKQNIDVCEEYKSTIEVGDNFKTLSDIQREQAEQLKNAAQNIKVVESVTNDLKGKVEDVSSRVEGAENETADVWAEMVKQSVELKNTSEKLATIVTEEYVKSSEYETYKSEVSSEFEQTKDMISVKFETTVENAEFLKKLYKYIQLGGDTAITIGSGNNTITLELDNEKGIIFKKNGIPFGEWDGENFYTGNIVVEVLKRAQFGDFAFVPRTDGSLALLKVGE